MKIEGHKKIFEVGDKNDNWEILKIDKEEYTFKCLHCGRIREGVRQIFIQGKCICQSRHPEQLSYKIRVLDRGKEQKRGKNVFTKKKESCLSPMPKELDPISCRKLIYAILYNALIDSKRYGLSCVEYFIDSNYCKSLCEEIEINVDLYRAEVRRVAKKVDGTKEAE